MSKNNSFHLLQYSATGVLFYTAYENAEEQFSISTLVGSPEMRIHTKTTTYFVKTMKRQPVINSKRIIQNECGETLATLRKCKDNEYLLQDNEGELTIVREDHCFYDKSDEQEVFCAKRIENLRDLPECYRRQGYDLTYGYQVVFSGRLSEQRKMWICSFPMLWW